MTDFPSVIKFVSCSSEVSFVSELSNKDKKLKDRMAEYVYVKCNLNGVLMDTSVTLSMGQIDSLLSSHLIQIT